MPREAFDRELHRLQDEIAQLGHDIAMAILESVEILKRQDLAAARCLIAADQEINRRRFAIEADCLTLVATQQPMARDLRILAAILEIVTELERTGDYAKGVARITIAIGAQPLIKPLIDIPRMAEKATNMLQRALQAFATRDVAAARAIPKEDDEVDALYNQVYRELLIYIMKDPSTLDQATHLLWVAHNLERAADRVTNICERIVFMVTGEMRELDSEDGVIADDACTLGLA